MHYGRAMIELIPAVLLEWFPSASSIKLMQSNDIYHLKKYPEAELVRFGDMKYTHQIIVTSSLGILWIKQARQQINGDF